MNKLSGRYLIVMVLTISVAVILIGYVKADAQWEAEWKKTLEAGKKEGKVSVYVSSIAPGLRKQAIVFAKQFGIEMDITSGRGSQLREKLRTENTAGLNLADVVIS
ncbi:MAG: hypothetical protein Q8P24_21340, partial [Desulfobacterales bacterium]|nr:hypothetical protein [Desulfobacterales bacterium]